MDIIFTTVGIIFLIGVMIISIIGFLIAIRHRRVHTVVF